MNAPKSLCDDGTSPFSDSMVERLCKSATNLDIVGTKKSRVCNLNSPKWNIYKYLQRQLQLDELFRSDRKPRNDDLFDMIDELAAKRIDDQRVEFDPSSLQHRGGGDNRSVTLDFGEWRSRKTTKRLRMHHPTKIYAPPKIIPKSKIVEFSLIKSVFLRILFALLKIPFYLFIKLPFRIIKFFIGKILGILNHLFILTKSVFRILFKFPFQIIKFLINKIFGNFSSFMNFSYAPLYNCND